jgi:hypothetical protein
VGGKQAVAAKVGGSVQPLSDEQLWQPLINCQIEVVAAHTTGGNDQLHGSFIKI